VLHLVHVPLAPGQGMDARNQARIGRARLLSMPFETFESRIRDDLTRMLGPGGFDAGRDIRGITVGRWSHGYAYTPSSLYDDVEAHQGKQEAMKARLGNIAFANSDTGWDAYAHTAMSEAVRAVGELTGLPPPPYKPRWQERFQALFRRKPLDEPRGEGKEAKSGEAKGGDK
jgi:spermidine dehydrogenase